MTPGAAQGKPWLFVADAASSCQRSEIPGLGSLGILNPERDRLEARPHAPNIAHHEVYHPAASLTLPNPRSPGSFWKPVPQRFLAGERIVREVNVFQDNYLQEVLYVIKLDTTLVLGFIDYIYQFVHFVNFQTQHLHWPVYMFICVPNGWVTTSARYIEYKLKSIMFCLETDYA